MYLTYYVHLVGINEVIDCKNAWSGKLNKIIYWLVYFLYSSLLHLGLSLPLPGCCRCLTVEYQAWLSLNLSSLLKAFTHSHISLASITRQSTMSYILATILTF